ncbi:multicopper oxidase family protein [uncultured Bradyrhizobium sp.]|uniref:multicopper oxidase family protein n=1 Tax=uncultured Bradyrhizobium sp. TaxID=199684 RepID=UPI0035CC53B6
MTDRDFKLDRRGLLAGLGTSILVPAMLPRAVAQQRTAVMLRARPGAAVLHPGRPDTPVWLLQGPETGMRFRRGDQLDVTLGNELPVPVVLSWRGIDGVAAAEPLAARPPLAPGSSDTFPMPLRHAGTFLCDLRSLGDNLALPSPVRAFVVRENEPVAVDRDEIVLIEDWRLRPDGSAVAPGSDATDATPLYTVNGNASQDIATSANARLRLRFINACQRDIIALKIEDHNLQVMAIDSQPSEPFLARNGQLVLAPGTRIDAFVDTILPPGSTSSILLHDGTETRPIGRLVYSAAAPLRTGPLPPAAPLPSNGLPAQLDLRNALRVDLILGGTGSPADWRMPVNFSVASTPAFRAKPGRTVVLALTSGADSPTVFHLHGHHFRLLDRLDDGWKPFWLDTLVIAAGQTQRIAFAAETAGRWLIESVATNWAAPRRVRWYSVE